MEGETTTDAPPQPGIRLRADSFRVTMILCDHAQVADSKLFIAGGGWSVTSSPTRPSAIALLLQVPWGEANRKITFTLGLFTEDGDTVTQDGPAGQPVPVAVKGELEVGRPPGLPEGSLLDAPFAINIQPLVLEPGQRHYWQLEINSETRADWRLSFYVRPMAKA